MFVNSFNKHKLNREYWLEWSIAELQTFSPSQQRERHKTHTTKMRKNAYTLKWKNNHRNKSSPFQSKVVHELLWGGQPSCLLVLISWPYKVSCLLTPCCPFIAKDNALFIEEKYWANRSPNLPWSPPQLHVPVRLASGTQTWSYMRVPQELVTNADFWTPSPGDWDSAVLR